MALAMTKLTNQGIESAESVAASALEWASDTGGTVLNAGAGDMFMDVMLQISIAFHASAVLGAELHIRYSSDDATTEDTEGTYTFARAIAVSAGNTVTISHRVPGPFDYLDVGVKNLDTGQALTWTGIYSGTKLTGMD